MMRVAVVINPHAIQPKAVAVAALCAGLRGFSSHARSCIADGGRDGIGDPATATVIAGTPSSQAVTTTVVRTAAIKRIMIVASRTEILTRPGTSSE